MSKINIFWKKNYFNILAFLGLILVSVLSFQAGYLKGKAAPDNPMVIEFPVKNESFGGSGNIADKKTATATTANSDTENINRASSDSARATNCLFVGSKNSNKYHLPNCQWSKRIKPENIVCFSSSEDASSRGYQPDKGCIK